MAIQNLTKVTALADADLVPAYSQAAGLDVACTVTTLKAQILSGLTLTHAADALTTSNVAALQAQMTPISSANFVALATAGGLATGGYYDVTGLGLQHALTASTYAPIGQSSTIKSQLQVCFFGDSITNSAGQVTLYGFRISTTSGGFTSNQWAILGCDPETPAGTGSLIYNATTKLMTWTAPGESAGVAVDVSRTGIYYCASSVAGHGITFTWDGSLTTSYTSGTLSVTVPADGNQYQAVFNSRGYPVCAMAQIGQAAAIAQTTVYPYGLALGGVPGFGSASLLAASWQTSQVLGDADVINIGTNDIQNTTTHAQIIANIQAFIATRIALGVRAIGVCTIPPRATGTGRANTAAEDRKRNAVNRWIKDYCSTYKSLACLDISAAIEDPTSGAWLTNYSTDGIHPANLGAWAMGTVIKNWLATMVSGSPYYPAFNDVYNATDNPYGAWVSGTGYLSFEGTGGATTGGVTATIPANWNVNRQSGSTVITAVGSKVARTDNVGGSWYQLAITGAANESLSLTPQSNPLTLSTLGVVAGDKLEGFLEVNIPASSGMRFCNMRLSWVGILARTVEAFTDVIIGSNAVLTDNMGKFWLRLPATTVPVGATGVSISIRVGADTSATVQLGRWWVAKVRPV